MRSVTRYRRPKTMSSTWVLPLDCRPRSAVAYPVDSTAPVFCRTSDPPRTALAFQCRVEHDPRRGRCEPAADTRVLKDDRDRDVRGLARRGGTEGDEPRVGGDALSLIHI